MNPRFHNSRVLRYRVVHDRSCDEWTVVADMRYGWSVVFRGELAACQARAKLLARSGSTRRYSNMDDECDGLPTV